MYAYILHIEPELVLCVHNIIFHKRLVYDHVHHLMYVMRIKIIRKKFTEIAEKFQNFPPCLTTL